LKRCFGLEFVRVPQTGHVGGPGVEMHLNRDQGGWHGRPAVGEYLPSVHPRRLPERLATQKFEICELEG
jgi:hypothetical protein